VEIVAAVEGFEGRAVRLRDGARSEPEVVVAGPGLRLIGFSNPPTGTLREMALDARRIARRIQLARAAPGGRPG
jgi:hypothetical protein